LYWQNIQYPDVNDHIVETMHEIQNEINEGVRD